MRATHLGLLVLFGALLLTGGSLLSAAPVRPDGAAAEAAAPLLPTATPTLTPPPLTGCWVLTTPVPSNGRADIVSVYASGPNDAWAVGHHYCLGTCPQAQHWDGTAWTEITPPFGGTGNLWGVSGTAANDVWTVGGSRIFHWDSTGWTSFPHPTISYLWAVTARTTNDAWAVGSENDILHWDGTAWSQVPDPNIGVLYAVAARAADDAWAVGSYDLNGETLTLIEHWDGTGWTQVPSPNLQPGVNRLNGVVALAANNAWAVGWSDSSAPNTALLEHWDGTSWTLVPVPAIGQNRVHLYAIAAVNAADIWTVGDYQSQTTVNTLVLHWDGAVWSVVASPNTGWSYNGLHSVAVAGPDEAWAGGNYDYPASSGNHTQILHYQAPCVPPPPPPCNDGFNIVPGPTGGVINDFAAAGSNDIWAAGSAFAHWDGTAWIPVDGGGNATYNGITRVATDNLWAVGTTNDGIYDRTAIAHWDGTTWTRVPSPNLPYHDNYLTGISARTATDIWAVGYAVPECCGTERGLIEHWDGTAWSIVPVPNNPVFDNQLYGVVALAANNVWAVGDRIVHWDGLTWSVVVDNSRTLRAVTAISASDIWAVGHGYNSNLLMHWDGTRWSTLREPVYVFLSDVSALATNDVWAVGVWGSGNNTYGWAEHWDGLTWSKVPVEDWGERYNIINAVAAIGPNNVWAGGSPYMRVEHYTGPCNPTSPTPTPLVSATPWPIDTATPTPGLSPSATPIPPCPPWNIVASPNPPGVGAGAILDDVAVASLTDLWAVGSASTATGTLHTLIEHGNGTTWTIVPSPNIGSGDNELHGVTVVAPDNIWAVGSSTSSTGPILLKQPLILHWDGTAWSVVPAPNPGDGPAVLNAVAALSATDAWAAGYLAATNSWVAPLLLHWDGTAWTPVTVLNPISGGGAFTGVVALAADNVWAVGGAAFEPLIEHWDGTAWSWFDLRINGLLKAVTARNPDDIWAVGSTTGATGGRGTFILHWNGQAWSQIASPSPSQVDLLYDVVTVPNSATEVWAVGLSTSGNGLYQPLVLHWDGTTWGTVPGATTPGSDTALLGLAASGPTDLWAVGYGRINPLRTLTEHYLSPCGAPSPTPTATATAFPSTTATPTRPAPPASATATATPPGSSTATPLPLPTACTLSFVDVPPGSPFYDFVRCLACRRIVGGYPCGSPGEPCPGTYYRPANNVTRGQVSKIVSISAAFADPIPGIQQTFADVPPSSTFWLWVERLAGRGIISGYPCGGPFEPCIAPANRPYFRPNNDVTRGQLSKIVAGAAGWTETPTSQTFQDVPPGSTFYLFVERVASRGIVGGYPCGGAGEPCIAPGNRPYFRPSNNATRGQMSKIAAGAFFPNCPTPVR